MYVLKKSYINLMSKFDLSHNYSTKWLSFKHISYVRQTKPYCYKCRNNSVLQERKKNDNTFDILYNFYLPSELIFKIMKYNNPPPQHKKKYKDVLRHIRYFGKIYMLCYDPYENHNIQPSMIKMNIMKKMKWNYVC